MLLWRFATYVSPSGRSDVQDTVDRYDDYSSAAFERAVAHLSVSAKSQWNEPHAKKLKDKDPLYEVIYKANRCATRALGFFDDPSRTFTITLICTHKQNVYKPANAFETAQNRAKQIINGDATAVPLQLHGENFPTDE